MRPTGCLPNTGYQRQRYRERALYKSTFAAAAAKATTTTTTETTAESYFGLHAYDATEKCWQRRTSQQTCNCKELLIRAINTGLIFPCFVLDLCTAGKNASEAVRTAMK